MSSTSSSKPTPLCVMIASGSSEPSRESRHESSARSFAVDCTPARARRARRLGEVARQPHVLAPSAVSALPALSPSGRTATNQRSSPPRPPPPAPPAPPAPTAAVPPSTRDVAPREAARGDDLVRASSGDDGLEREARRHERRRRARVGGRVAPHVLGRVARELDAAPATAPPEVGGAAPRTRTQPGPISLRLSRKSSSGARPRRGCARTSGRPPRTLSSDGARCAAAYTTLRYVVGSRGTATSANA